MLVPMCIRRIFISMLLLLGTQLYGQTGLLNTEYFWDADPGEGNGTALVAVDGSYGQALEHVLATTSTLPVPGEHTFSIRALDEDGNWGPVFSTLIQVLPSAVSFPDIHVSQGEYFWDSDPGEGNGSTLFALDGLYDNAMEAVGADINQLPAPGMHVLGMRMLDVNNNWGAPFSILVEVLAGSVSFPDIHVAAAEYWFDSDPGEGAGMPMLASDGSFDGAFEAIKGGAIPPVEEGINVLWMRAQDDDGGWGPPFGVVVNVDTTITGTVQVPDLAHSSAVIVAPNPTTSDAGFWIEQQGEVQRIQVKVVDSQGRLVLEQDFGAQPRVDVALEGLAPGLYPVGVYRGGAVTWHSIVVR